MYSYYLKRTFVVTNVEKLTGFFFYRTLKIFKHVQPTIQTAHTVSELLVYKPSEKLKVILSVSSPSSNPEEDSLFSCVSSPTCRCSVWPKAAPATEHLPLPFPSSSPLHHQLLTWNQLLLGKFMPKLLLLDSAWMQIQEKAFWGQCPLHCSHGVLSEKPFNDTALCGGVFI